MSLLLLLLLLCFRRYYYEYGYCYYFHFVLQFCHKQTTRSVYMFVCNTIPSSKWEQNPALSLLETFLWAKLNALHIARCPTRKYEETATTAIEFSKCVHVPRFASKCTVFLKCNYFVCTVAVCALFFS